MSIKHPYMYDRDANRRPIIFPEGTRTKQAFRDECDINKLMAKYQKTGILNHFNKHAPAYGDANSADLHEAMTILAEAQTMFDELPSSVRKKFSNPAEFLEFVEDTTNEPELIKLGLAARKPIPEPLLVRVQPEPAPEPDPA